MAADLLLCMNGEHDRGYGYKKGLLEGIREGREGGEGTKNTEDKEGAF